MIHNLPDKRGIRMDFYVEAEDGKIYGFDLFGYGRYRYTFQNCCVGIPGLKLGDESTRAILNTKGTDAAGAEQSLVDFLHNIGDSREENLPEDCDERIQYLHKVLNEMKQSERMGY